MKSWYIYFVAMMVICGLGCNRTASKKQVMQIGPADAQCLNCDTLGDYCADEYDTEPLSA